MFLLLFCDLNAKIGFYVTHPNATKITVTAAKNKNKKTLEAPKYSTSFLSVPFNSEWQILLSHFCSFDVSFSITVMALVTDISIFSSAAIVTLTAK